MMRKTVKTLSVLLTLCMLFGCFAGCRKGGTDGSSSDEETVIVYIDDSEAESTVGDSSNKTESSNEPSSGNTSSKTVSSSKNNEKRDLKGRTITFMTIWSEPEKGTSSFWNNYWKVKTEVQKEYNCTFKHVYGTGNWYDTWVASVMAGTPSADVICCKEDPYSSIKSGLFYDVSKLSEFDFKEDKWQRTILDLGKVNNNQYVFGAAKFQPDTILLYNKEMLAANGIKDLYTLQKNGKLSLDDFISIATQLKTKTGKASVLPGINVFNVHKWFAWACGGKFMSRTANTISLSSTVDSNAVKTGFEKAQALVNSGVIETNTDTSNWLWSREQFSKGNYPILLAGDLETALKNASFTVGACRMPSASGGYMNITDTIQWCAMPYNVKNPEDVALVFNRMADVIFIVDYKSRYQDIATDDIMEMINEQVKDQANGKYELDYSGIFLNDIWDNGVGTALRSMTTGAATPAQTIQTVKNLFASLITNKFGK